MNVTFVVPARDEEANLPHLLDNVQRISGFFGFRHRILVVDAGSTDGTAAFVRAAERTLPVRLLSHGRNLGPGAAFRTGFAAALAEAADEDVVVTIEADNTGDLCILGRMVEKIRRGADLVLASVYGHGRVVGAPLDRVVLSWCANRLLAAVFRIPGVHTFSSFFRAHRAAALRRAAAVHGETLIEEPGFVCMVELLVKLHALGCRIEEVPMLLDFRMRIGESRMKTVRTTAGYLRIIARQGLRPRLAGR